MPKGMRKILLLFILGLIFITSCSNKKLSQKDESFLKLISASDLNNKVQLSLLEGKPKPRIGDCCTLKVENRSKDKITFPTDFGIYIFTYNDQSLEWVLVENNVEYLPKGKTLTLETEGSDNLHIFPLEINPAIKNEDHPIEIRVFVSGKITRPKTTNTEVVGAYKDILVEP